MPDFASCRLDSTSWVLFPMDETMPIPVMTTRLMFASPYLSLFLRLRVMCVHAALRSSRRGALLEQPDPQVLGAIDNLAVGGKPPVRDAQPELHAHHALDVDIVHNLAHVRHHLAGELQVTEAQRTATALAAGPAEEKAEHLPERVEAEAARHHRIALEVADEETKGGFEVE